MHCPEARGAHRMSLTAGGRHVRNVGRYTQTVGVSYRRGWAQIKERAERPRRRGSRDAAADMQQQAGKETGGGCSWWAGERRCSRVECSNGPRAASLPACKVGFKGAMAPWHEQLAMRT